MTIVSLAAFAIALIAPFAQAIAWGVPITVLSWGMGLRAGIGAALTTVVIGAFATLMVPAHIAASIAAAAGGALMLLGARRSRHLRGVALLAYRVTRESSREEGVRLLSRKLKRLAKTLAPAKYAELALFASVPLTAVDEWEVAGEHLAAIDVTQLEGSLADRANQALATIRLEQSDFEGTQAIIDRVPRPADAAVELWLGAMEALLLALQGGADKALEYAAAAPEDDVAIAAAYDIVRAHALASKGDQEGAKDALMSLCDRAGEEALERAVRPVGPATDLARAMIAS